MHLQEKYKELLQKNRDFYDNQVKKGKNRHKEYISRKAVVGILKSQEISISFTTLN